MRTAAQIWRTLSNMYSRKGNVMVMMEIQSKADAVKQAGRSVEQYASELQYLWGELDHYAPLSMRDPQDAQDVQKWVEDRRVTQFFKNLDPEFESRRAAFCHQDSLPTMEEAVSAMVNEESRLRVMSNNNPVKSAYVTLGKRDCYNCGEKGHLSYNCPLPKNCGEKGHLSYNCPLPKNYGGRVVLVEVVVVLVVVKEEAVEAVLEVVAEGVVALMPMLLLQRMSHLSP